MNRKGRESLVPIPPAEVGLHTIMAKPWLQINPAPTVLIEGPAFDREGNLFVVSIFDGRVFKINPNKEVSTIFSNNSVRPGDCAIHKDGRLFVGCISGQILTMNPDGSGITEVKAKYEGKPIAPNGIVFDPEGNFYVSDSAGTVVAPMGGVYRYSADLKIVRPIIQNLVIANGIVLAPKGVTMPSPVPVGYELWVAESGLNRLIHLRLQEDGITPAHPSVNVTYYFVGDSGPDSSAIDVEGNLYQTIIGQGRILILNKAGIPVAQVLIPGRDEGKNLMTSNLAFKPDTDEAFITLSGTEGAWIYTFHGLAKGLKLFSHQ